MKVNHETPSCHGQTNGLERNTNAFIRSMNEAKRTDCSFRNEKIHKKKATSVTKIPATRATGHPLDNSTELKIQHLAGVIREGYPYLYNNTLPFDALLDVLKPWSVVAKPLIQSEGLTSGDPSALLENLLRELIPGLDTALGDAQLAEKFRALIRRTDYSLAQWVDALTPDRAQHTGAIKGGVITSATGLTAVTERLNSSRMALLTNQSRGLKELVTGLATLTLSAVAAHQIAQRYVPDDEGAAENAEFKSLDMQGTLVQAIAPTFSFMGMLASWVRPLLQDIYKKPDARTKSMTDTLLQVMFPSLGERKLQAIKQLWKTDPAGWKLNDVATALMSELHTHNDITFFDAVNQIRENRAGITDKNAQFKVPGMAEAFLAFSQWFYGGQSPLDNARAQFTLIASSKDVMASLSDIIWPVPTGPEANKLSNQQKLERLVRREWTDYDVPGNQNVFKGSLNPEGTTENAEHHDFDTLHSFQVRHADKSDKPPGQRVENAWPLPGAAAFEVNSANSDEQQSLMEEGLINVVKATQIARVAGIRRLGLVSVASAFIYALGTGINALKSLYDSEENDSSHEPPSEILDLLPYLLNLMSGHPWQQIVNISRSNTTDEHKVYVIKNIMHEHRINAEKLALMQADKVTDETHTSKRTKRDLQNSASSQEVSDDIILHLIDKARSDGEEIADPHTSGAALRTFSDDIWRPFNEAFDQLPTTLPVTHQLKGFSAFAELISLPVFNPEQPETYKTDLMERLKEYHLAQEANLPDEFKGYIGRLSLTAEWQEGAAQSLVVALYLKYCLSRASREKVRLDRSFVNQLRTVAQTLAVNFEEASGYKYHPVFNEIYQLFDAILNPQFKTEGVIRDTSTLIDIDQFARLNNPSNETLLLRRLRSLPGGNDYSLLTGYNALLQSLTIDSADEDGQDDKIDALMRNQHIVELVSDVFASEAWESAGDEGLFRAASLLKVAAFITRCETINDNEVFTLQKITDALKGYLIRSRIDCQQLTSELDLRLNQKTSRFEAHQMTMSNRLAENLDKYSFPKLYEMLGIKADQSADTLTEKLSQLYNEISVANNSVAGRQSQAARERWLLSRLPANMHAAVKANANYAIKYVFKRAVAGIVWKKLDDFIENHNLHYDFLRHENYNDIARRAFLQDTKRVNGFLRTLDAKNVILSDDDMYLISALDGSGFIERLFSKVYRELNKDNFIESKKAAIATMLNNISSGSRIPVAEGKDNDELDKTLILWLRTPAVQDAFVKFLRKYFPKQATIFESPVSMKLSASLLNKIISYSEKSTEEGKDIDARIQRFVQSLMPYKNRITVLNNQPLSELSPKVRTELRLKSSDTDLRDDMASFADTSLLKTNTLRWLNIQDEKNATVKKILDKFSPLILTGATIERLKSCQSITVLRQILTEWCSSAPGRAFASILAGMPVTRYDTAYRVISASLKSLIPAGGHIENDPYSLEQILAKANTISPGITIEKGLLLVGFASTDALRIEEWESVFSDVKIETYKPSIIEITPDPAHISGQALSPNGKSLSAIINSLDSELLQSLPLDRQLSVMAHSYFDNQASNALSYTPVQQAGVIYSILLKRVPDILNLVFNAFIRFQSNDTFQTFNQVKQVLLVEIQNLIKRDRRIMTQSEVGILAKVYLHKLAPELFIHTDQNTLYARTVESVYLTAKVRTLETLQPGSTLGLEEKWVHQLIEDITKETGQDVVNSSGADGDTNRNHILSILDSHFKDAISIWGSVWKFANIDDAIAAFDKIHKQYQSVQVSGMRIPEPLKNYLIKELTEKNVDPYGYFSEIPENAYTGQKSTVVYNYDAYHRGWLTDISASTAEAGFDRDYNNYVSVMTPFIKMLVTTALSLLPYDILRALDDNNFAYVVPDKTLYQQGILGGLLIKKRNRPHIYIRLAFNENSQIIAYPVENPGIVVAGDEMHTSQKIHFRAELSKIINPFSSRSAGAKIVKKISEHIWNNPMMNFVKSEVRGWLNSELKDKRVSNLRWNIVRMLPFVPCYEAITSQSFTPGTLVDGTSCLMDFLPFGPIGVGLFRISKMGLNGSYDLVLFSLYLQNSRRVKNIINQPYLQKVATGFRPAQTILSWPGLTNIFKRAGIRLNGQVSSNMSNSLMVKMPSTSRQIRSHYPLINVGEVKVLPTDSTMEMTVEWNAAGKIELFINGKLYRVNYRTSRMVSQTGRPIDWEVSCEGTRVGRAVDTVCKAKGIMALNSNAQTMPQEGVMEPQNHVYTEWFGYSEVEGAQVMTSIPGKPGAPMKIIPHKVGYVVPYGNTYWSVNNPKAKPAPIKVKEKGLEAFDGVVMNEEVSGKLLSQQGIAGFVKLVDVDSKLKGVKVYSSAVVIESKTGENYIITNYNGDFFVASLGKESPDLAMTDIKFIKTINRPEPGTVLDELEVIYAGMLSANQARKVLGPKLDIVVANLESALRELDIASLEQLVQRSGSVESNALLNHFDCQTSLAHSILFHEPSRKLFIEVLEGKAIFPKVVAMTPERQSEVRNIYSSIFSPSPGAMKDMEPEEMLTSWMADMKKTKGNRIRNVYFYKENNNVYVSLSGDPDHLKSGVPPLFNKFVDGQYVSDGLTYINVDHEIMKHYPRLTFEDFMDAGLPGPLPAIVDKDMLNNKGGNYRTPDYFRIYDTETKFILYNILREKMELDRIGLTVDSYGVTAIEVCASCKFNLFMSSPDPKDLHIYYVMGDPA